MIKNETIKKNIPKIFTGTGIIIFLHSYNAIKKHKKIKIEKNIEPLIIMKIKIGKSIIELKILLINSLFI